MNAVDILKYGHLQVVAAVDHFPETQWDTANVCGVWSSKEIIAHLASFEHLLIEVLNGFLKEGDPTPYLAEMGRDPQAFNDNQVGQRRQWRPEAVLDEYRRVQAATMELISQIPAETARRPGLLPWYGLEYSLDDFIVYTYYGHKREHCAQIMVFRDQVGS
jgi:hypothetical protein